MRDVRPSINAIYNYLEGYYRILQNDYVQNLDLHANLAKFSTKVDNLNQTMVKNYVLTLVILIPDVGI